MLRSPILRALSLFVFASGCASVTSVPGGGDGSACVTDAYCGGGCSSEKDCEKGQKCDPDSHACVSCIVDQDCPLGELCKNHVCGKGCSLGQPCGDAGVCEVDAGLCVECRSDGDCTDKAKPRCDPQFNKCVPCLPDKDNCDHAQYCDGMNGAYACAPGCKNDQDCNDGGDAGAGPLECDTMKHQCVNCLKDSECPLGKVCHSGMCVSGCNNMQKCPNPLACCTMTCVDTTTDYQNCGGCGKTCNNGWNCCNSMCSNPANDAMNCGGCGIVCTTPHGTPACVLRNCAIAKCDPGWADCDGSSLDGCEINTDTNVGNCGGCNNPCNLPNASPKCVGGMCQVAACALGFADCNMLPQDGCEVNVFGDVNNCNGCGVVCAPANASPKCSLGMCQVGACNPGFLNCDGIDANGCEVNQLSDVNHCGSCNIKCSSQNGAPACNNGVCSIQCNGGFADCNNNPADGCEVNLNVDNNHCGGCQTSCGNLAPHTTSGACQNGMCVVTGCQNNFFDLDGQWGDGCECAGDGVGSSCGNATGKGQLTIGQSINITGNVVPANSEDWYQITFAGDHGSKSFHAQVAFGVNPNNWFRFDVFADCANNGVNCSDGASTGLTQWEIYWGDQGSGAYNPIGAFGNNNTVYIRVRRVAGPVTCDSYTLTVSD